MPRHHQVEPAARPVSLFPRRIHHQQRQRCSAYVGRPRAIGPHTLRHTFASLMLAKRANLKALSVRLGHSSTAITSEVYSHVIAEVAAQTVEQVDTILEEVLGHTTATFPPKSLKIKSGN